MSPDRIAPCTAFEIFSRTEMNMKYEILSQSPPNPNVDPSAAIVAFNHGRGVAQLILLKTYGAVVLQPLPCALAPVALFIANSPALDLLACQTTGAAPGASRQRAVNVAGM